MEEVIEVTESTLAQAVKIWVAEVDEHPEDFGEWFGDEPDPEAYRKTASYLIKILKTL